MIGAELASRVSPQSLVRAETLVPNEAQDCWTCGAPFTACTHSADPPLTTIAEEVVRLVTERGAQQARRPGRPPKAKAAFSEKVEPVAPEPEVAPMVAPAGPVGGVEVAPGDTTAPVAAPIPPPPVGADYGSRVETLSPISPEVEIPRVSATSIPAGDPHEVYSTYDVPPGRMDPADDPSCPDAVLVSDLSQIGATGAWMTLPNGTQAALTHEVILVSWQDGTKNPLYRLVGPAGAIIPRPAGS